jgi:hypothetical protein
LPDDGIIDPVAVEIAAPSAPSAPGCTSACSRLDVSGTTALALAADVPEPQAAAS